MRIPTKLSSKVLDYTLRIITFIKEITIAIVILALVMTILYCITGVFNAKGLFNPLLNALFK